MSVRNPLVRPAELRVLLAGAAMAGLMGACSMPAPVEPPPPPPEAELEEPELYGGPTADAEAQAYADTQVDSNNPYADQGPPDPAGLDGVFAEAEARRPGWGTMEPIPNPAPGERGRAYAEAAPVRSAPPARTLSPTPSPVPMDEPGQLPRVEDRLGAYAAGPAPAQPAPFVEPPVYEAPVAEGQPAASYPPVIVTMRPVPNPEERAATQPRTEPARREMAAAPAPQRRAEAAPTQPRRESRPAVRAAADRRLAGGPAPAQPPRAAASADRSARNTSAAVRAPVQQPARQAAGAPARANTAANRPATQPAARNQAQAQAPLPPANTPAGRAARLKRLEGGLSQLVQRDATLTVPERIVPGQTEQITLTLPQGLSETLTRQAGEIGLRDLARQAEVRTTLSGQGWRVEPEEPQTDELRTGRINSFTWSATPERGAGPLSADVDLALQGGGRFETLQLGQLTREIEDGGISDLSVNGLSWRALGAGLLLLAAIIGAFFFVRRGDGGGRVLSRRPEPVNLTPYSHGANTDAPRDEPTRA
jgi:hypothetical protein